LYAITGVSYEYDVTAHTQRSRYSRWHTCIVGARVPLKTLLDYLEAGDALDVFLDHFRSVGREQAVAVLEQDKEMLIAYAYTTCGEHQ